MRLLISRSWVQAPRWAPLFYRSIRQFIPIDQTLPHSKQESGLCYIKKPEVKPDSFRVYKTKNTSATTGDDPERSGSDTSYLTMQPT